jgi:hypothetical protein
MGRCLPLRFAGAARFELEHAGGPGLAFGLAGAKYQDGLAVLPDHFADELVGGPNFEAFGIIAKLVPKELQEKMIQPITHQEVLGS